MASFKEINTESSLNLMGEDELDQEFEKLFNKKHLADPLTTDTMARPSSKLEIPEEFDDLTLRDAYLNDNSNNVMGTAGSAQDEELQRMEQQWINELQESIQLSMLVDDHGSIQYKANGPGRLDRNYAPAPQQQQQFDVNPFRELQEDKCDFEKSILTISDRHTPESPEHKPLLIDVSTLQAVEHFRRSTDQNINNEIQLLRERIKELENMAELNETVQHSKEYFSRHKDDDHHLLKHDKQTQTSNDHEQSSQYRLNLPATKESESIELIKLRNQITSLESKLSVLERRVEYYEFVAKTAEEERDKLQEKLKRVEKTPLDKTSPKKSSRPKEPHVVNDLAEVSMVKASPEKSKSSTKHDNIIEELSKENENTQAWKSTGAKRIIVNGKSPLIPAQRQSLKEVWKNGSKKEEIKRQLKKSIVASRHTSRSPSRFDVQVQKPPFLVGTSITPSFNLNANIQQIKALLKQHDPAVCDICNSAQRVSRASRRSLGQPQIHHWTNEELRLILEELEAEYRHFSYNYNVLVKTNASGKDIKAMKQNMDYLKNEIERIRSILGPNLDHLQPRQPSKAFINLCKLRSTQKLREALLKEESLEHARVFGGSSPLRSSMAETVESSGWVSSILYNLVAIAFVGISSLAGVLYYNQTRIVYPSFVPEGARTQVDAPTKYGMKNFKELFLETPDKVKLHAYFILQESASVRKKAPTVLYCHANAGNMGHRLPIVKMFYERFNANILIFSYRGYGKSDLNWTSEAGMKIDAQTALEYLLASDEINKSRIVIFGQSIGGAVAIDLMAQNEGLFKAGILENTFLSIPKVVPHVLPLLKHFLFLCTEIWDSEKRIKGIERLPLLFLASERDELVPHEHMKQLYKIVPTNKKRFVVVPKGTHNDAPMYPVYWESVEKFWKDYV